MAKNTIQNFLRYIGSVMVIVDLKMKDAKEVSLKKNGTGMSISQEGIDKEYVWQGYQIIYFKNYLIQKSPPQGIF